MKRSHALIALALVMMTTFTMIAIDPLEAAWACEVAECSLWCYSNPDDMGCDSGSATFIIRCCIQTCSAYCSP